MANILTLNIGSFSLFHNWSICIVDLDKSNFNMSKGDVFFLDLDFYIDGQISLLVKIIPSADFISSII